MFDKLSITLHTGGKPFKVHLVSTGAVAVKTKFRENKRSGFAALLSFLFDKNFTDWLPIYVMIVEHPEGIFIIDAGEITEVNNRDYYFRSSGFIANWFDKTQFKFSVTREDEIDKHLLSLNIPLKRIKAIILTHLHFDHTDGIKYFPQTNILVNKSEWKKPFGDLPKLYPSWFKPQLVSLTDSFDVFDKAKFLTETKDIILIETPGHTYHHCSVLIKADECCVMFAADICYSQQQLLHNKFPGNNASNKLAKETYERVRSFAKNYPLVFIPSHDAEAKQRLQQLKKLLL